MATNIQLVAGDDDGGEWSGKINASLSALRATIDTAAAQAALLQQQLNTPDPEPGVPVGQITNFRGTVLSNTSVQLDWTYTGDPLTSYLLTQGGVTITPPAAAAETITVTGLTAGTAYTWALTGNFTAGGSTPTVTASRTTTSTADTITLTAVQGIDYADLTWTEVAGSTGYKVGHDSWSTIDPATATTRRLLYLDGRNWTAFVEAQPSGARAEVALIFADPEPPPPDEQPEVEPGGLGVSVSASTADPTAFQKDVDAAVVTGSEWIHVTMSAQQAGTMTAAGVFTPSTSGMNFFALCAQQAKAAGLKLAWCLPDAFNDSSWTDGQFNTFNGLYWAHVSSKIGQYVDFWQVFNEADLGDYRTNTTPTLNSTYLTRLSDALAVARTQLGLTSNAWVTTAASGNPTINSARYTIWTTFFDGIAASIDVIGIHGYPARDATAIANLATYITNLETRYTPKPVALLEFGLSTVAASGTIAQVGQGIVDQITAVMATDPYCAILNSLRDKGIVTTDPKQMTGILTTAWAQKGHYAAVTAKIKSYVQTPTNPPGLPTLGFSLNGAALAGPISPSHLAGLAAFTPAPVWARVGFSSDGDWRANVDAFVDPIRAAGMKVFLRASFPAAQFSGAVALDTAAYGTYVGQLAAYVKSRGLGPDDVMFEYPNEINATSITAAQYAAAAAAAYPILKAVDPNYQIIGGSEHVYLSNWQTWLTSLFTAGFMNNTDGISFHNYDVAGDHTKYTYLRNLMTTHGALSKTVWLSEFGVPTPPNPSGNPLGGQTPENQALLLVGILEDIGATLTWVTHAFVYCDLDIPSRSGTNEGWFGIYWNTATWVRTAKPAVLAIKNLYNTGGAAPPPVSTLSTTPLAAAVFPLAVRSDGRGFEDGDGDPFVGVCDTAWNAMSRMTLAEWTSYINTRRGQGYTAIITSMLDINSRSRTQVTTGVTPFAGTNATADFTAPNQTYFDAVKAKLDVAEAAGMFVWIVPGWYGYLGDRWRSNWADTASDFTVANSYAAYLAAQFGARESIGWMHGGDNNPDTANNAADNSVIKVSLVNVTNTFANALQSAAAADQLATYHTGRTYNAATWFAGQSWFQIDAAYAALDVPAETTVEWARGRSVMLTEAYYENRATVGVSTPHLTRLQLRNTAYHGLFTGALMCAAGNEVVWQVRDFYPSWVWNNATYGVGSVGAQDVKILSRVFATLSTKHWTADASTPLVTTNRGTGVTLSPGLKATDNTAAMVYIPSAKTVTVTHSSITGTKTGLWVNPETGATTAATIGASSASLTTPSGWSDAVLLIQGA